MNKKGLIKLPKFPKLFQDFNVIVLVNTRFYIFNYGANMWLTKTHVVELLEDLNTGNAIVIPKKIGVKLRELRKSDLDLATTLVEGMKITYKKETEELNSTLKEMYERAI